MLLSRKIVLFWWIVIFKVSESIKVLIKHRAIWMLLLQVEIQQEWYSRLYKSIWKI